MPSSKKKQKKKHRHDAFFPYAWLTPVLSSLYHQYFSEKSHYHAKTEVNKKEKYLLVYYTWFLCHPLSLQPLTGGSTPEEMFFGHKCKLKLGHYEWPHLSVGVWIPVVFAIRLRDPSGWPVKKHLPHLDKRVHCCDIWGQVW